MNPWLSLGFQFARLAAAQQTALLHAAVTIAQRWPVFADFALRPTATGAAEIGRAYDEKVTAAWMGGLNMALAWQEAAGALLIGATRAEALPGRLIAAWEAGLTPGHRTVRANARRLTRRR